MQGSSSCGTGRNSYPRTSSRYPFAGREPGARADRGIVAVIVAIVLPLILMILGLMLTLGIVYATEARAQGAADASALAAAATMSETHDPATATRQAQAYAASNYGTTPTEWAGCVDPHGYDVRPATGCVSYDMAAGKVRVVLPARRMPVIFGWLAGIPSDVPVTAGSVATWKAPIHLTT